ncbi:hypothetical protein LDC_0024 [sediment metagenome]|uniref:DUF4831 family protein n=1 Tax=sediment metagenome TaxID=749907 RepID=D9PEU6_9ZZZZ
MKYLALIIGIVLVLPVFGQRKKEDTVTPAFTEGVVYSLPRTGIRVKVKAVKETFIPGPYAAYAEQLLGIKNVKNRPAVNWVIEDVKIDVFSEPDPEQVYKALGAGAGLVSLSADGCIAGINTSSADIKKTEVFTNSASKKSKSGDNGLFQYFTDSPQYMAGDSTNNYRPIKLPDEQKISKAAQRILESRRIQFEIAAGLIDEFHPDGEAYQVSLEELKKIENDYLSLFVGKSTYDEESYGFDYIPKSGGKSEAIFRVSEENGIVPASDLSGKPVMIDFEIENELVQKYSGLAKSANPVAGESGVFYRIPGRAAVKLISDMNVIATARVTIAQFGVVAPLPEELLFEGYSIEYNTETGAIKSIQKK